MTSVYLQGITEPCWDQITLKYADIVNTMYLSHRRRNLWKVMILVRPPETAGNIDALGTCPAAQQLA